MPTGVSGVLAVAFCFSLMGLVAFPGLGRAPHTLRILQYNCSGTGLFSLHNWGTVLIKAQQGRRVPFCVAKLCFHDVTHRGLTVTEPHALLAGAELAGGANRQVRSHLRPHEGLVQMVIGPGGQDLVFVSGPLHVLELSVPASWWSSPGIRLLSGSVCLQDEIPTSCHT